MTRSKEQVEKRITAGTAQSPDSSIFAAVGVHWGTHSPCAHACAGVRVRARWRRCAGWAPSACMCTASMRLLHAPNASGGSHALRTWQSPRCPCMQARACNIGHPPPAPGGPPVLQNPQTPHAGHVKQHPCPLGGEGMAEWPPRAAELSWLKTCRGPPIGLPALPAWSTTCRPNTHTINPKSGATQCAINGRARPQCRETAAMQSFRTQSHCTAHPLHFTPPLEFSPRRIATAVRTWVSVREMVVCARSNFCRQRFCGA